MFRTLRNAFDSVLNSYSELFFIEGKWVGALVLVLSCLNPKVALMGFLALVSAYAFASFIGYRNDFLTSGFYTYNPTLVGFSIGTIFEVHPLSIGITIIAGVLTFIVSVALAQIFDQYLGIKILSVPFVIVSSLIYLAAAQFSNLYVKSLGAILFQESWINLPVVLIGFFKALGAIIFLPYIQVGVCLFVGCFFFSRIIPILALLGYFTGASISAVLTGHSVSAFLDINNFNYILIAIALGCIYLVPSIKSYIIALSAVAVSTLVVAATKVFWAYYGIPVFTLPFNLVTLFFLYVLGLVQF